MGKIAAIMRALTIWLGQTSAQSGCAERLALTVLLRVLNASNIPINYICGAAMGAIIEHPTFKPIAAVNRKKNVLISL